MNHEEHLRRNSAGIASPRPLSPINVHTPNSPFYHTRAGRSSSTANLAEILSRSTAPPSPKTTVHPAIWNVPELDAYVQGDPSALLTLIPDISDALEQFCLSQPHAGLELWSRLVPVLEFLAQQRALTEQRPIPERSESPVCEEKPVSWVNVHGEEWHDSFGWLNEKENPEVLEYIKAENEYAMGIMETTRPLQKLLYKEFVSRIDEDEETARTALSDGWTYYSKKVAGEEYQVHCRVDANGNEDIYLDENELANNQMFEDASYFKVNFLKHSIESQLVAFGVDSTGNERNTLLFMNINTKEILSDRIEGVYEDFEFSSDGRFAYYTVLDDCERAYQLKRHCIGAPVEQDEILFHEKDEMFYLSLSKTCDGRYIVLNTSAQITSETHFLDAKGNHEQLIMLYPRREKIQYVIESHGEYFYILTNEDTKNNWLFRIPIPKTAPQEWQVLVDQRETVIEHRDFVLIEDFGLRRNHLIVFERSNCLQNVRIVDLREDGFSSYHYIGFSELVYSLWPGAVSEEVADLTRSSQFDSDILRFTYTSFLQPKQVVDYNMDTRVMTIVHEEKVNGVIPYDRSLYASKRLFATGIDGTTIPISIVYRRDLLGLMATPPAANPMLLTGYGAYGAFSHTIFSSSRLSLLDRGFIFALAHIRGSADMGSGWYEEGKLAKKGNTFHDFISAAEHLIKEGYTSPEKLSIYGRSAGGLLISAVVNMRPDLFKAAISEVPFVDVINTMFDSSIPWTAFEYEEWGNPNDYEIYQHMKWYCPYTNVSGEALAKNEYPHYLVVAGMNDPRVAFFEPLKIVAKMRNERRKWRKQLGILRSKDDRMLLLKVDEAGHGGNSGQYSYFEDLAFKYAFVITALEAQVKPIYSGAMLPQIFSPMTPAIEAMRPGSQDSKKEKKKKHKDEDEYRRSRGDRGQNKLFQWVTNLF